MDKEMSKTIDKVNNEIIKALEKAKQSYREACDSSDYSHGQARGVLATKFSL